MLRRPLNKLEREKFMTKNRSSFTVKREKLICGVLAGTAIHRSVVSNFPSSTFNSTVHENLFKLTSV